jgi:sirohydrochlorin cobaltochelatase
MTAVDGGTTALVLAAHGDRGGEAPNRTLIGHRDRLMASGAFRSVTAGVFRGDPSLDDALKAANQSGANRILVYPLFMAAGYFTNKVLPERISSASLGPACSMLPPLGLDPALPQMMLDCAVATARGAGLVPAHARLLVVGHGSAGARASAKSTERAACWLRKTQTFAYTEAAFLEEEPFLRSRLGGAHPSTVVIGFFSGDGLHAAEDVPGAIRKADADAVYAGSVGRLPRVADLIQSAALRALGLPSPAQVA